LTSASGQERHFRDVREESGLPLTPDILRHRSEPPLRAITGREQVQQDAPENAPSNLLDHLVSAQHQASRDFVADALRDLEIDDQFEARWLLDRNGSGLSAA